MLHPDWFERLVNVNRLDHFVKIDNINIHYQTFAEQNNASNKPALLFVHGHAAHSHWWDFIAPAFCDSYHVAAMDMSGSGDSGHRQQYSAVGFAREILEVAKTLGEQCFIVGHSFGGSMTRIAAFLHKEIVTTSNLSGIVLADSMISSSKGKRAAITMPRIKQHFYPTLEYGKKRFRLRPPQPCENKYLLDYIAHHSLKQSNQGFEFKLDQAVFAKLIEHESIELPDAASMIEAINRSTPAIPVGFIYGDQSRFFNEKSPAFLESLFPKEQIRVINNAHHHVFLDQPLAFTESLQQVLHSLTH